MALPDDVAALFLSKPIWTLSEAASLVAGEVPGKRFPKDQPEALAKVRATYSEMQAAAASGEIRADVKEIRSGGQRVGMLSWGVERDAQYAPVRVTKDWPNASVEQSAVRAWTESRGLRPAIFARGEVEDRPLGTRERGTLLGILGALLELAGHDLRQPNGHFSIAAAIKAGLEDRGVRISTQTLAAKIAEARGEISPKGPSAAASPS